VMVADLGLERISCGIPAEAMGRKAAQASRDARASLNSR